MTTEEKIMKAKISLLISEPWFGQLACYLNLKARKAIECPTAAINERGDLFYNSKWIENLEPNQLKGLLCHEILHLALQHPFRCQNRNPVLWNIAADLKVNSEIHHNFKLPEGALLPEYGEWTFGKVKIKKIDEKTTEQIYDELFSKTPTFTISIDDKGGVSVETSNLPPSWKKLVDKMVKDLLKTKGRKGDVVPQDQIPSLARDWQERVNAANTVMKGDIPLGVKRELDALEHPELSWYQIIKQRFNRLLVRKTWRRPSKRWLPYYFPGVEKNKTLMAVTAIDTSGSMSSNDISKAVSEIWGIANSFRSFKLHIVTNDAEVWDILEVNNGNKAKILKLEPKGGGGTDFRPVFKLIKKRFHNLIDCLVFFTDGYGDFPSRKPSYPVYWVTRSDDVDWPFGKVIKLKSTPDD